MAASATASVAPRAFRVSAGRCFVGPVFDYLLIGGALSLPLVGLVVAASRSEALAPVMRQVELLTSPALLPYVILLVSGTHFAASTVRLYTKPGASASLPLLTVAFPLVALAVLTFCIARPESLGRQLQALYLTWSPYHYAAQAYGLAVMYSYRSGCLLPAREKRWLHWIALLPFFYAFVATLGAGLHWLMPSAVYEIPAFEAALGMLRPALVALGLAGPVVLYLKLQRGAGEAMPLICPLLLIANGLWWFVLPPLQAFVWATFFHGIQYLAIAVIFHVKDQTRRSGNRRGPLFHALAFYGMCLVLAYLLFNCLPWAYVWAGFSLTESLLLVVAAINLHHFIVDGFIWKLGRQDSNRAIVDSGAPARAPAIS
jgi:hypothetical protein